MRLWAAIVLLSGCVQTQTVECDSGGQTWTCPAKTICDPARVGCVTNEQLESCAGQPDGTACMIGSLQGVCETAVCEVSVCGDGFVVAPEQCDSGNFADVHACKDDRGFYDDVSPGCRDDCTYDYSTCTGYCGDGKINGQEICDGPPPDLTCVDVGYAAGALACSQCGPGLDDCKLLTWTSHLAPHQQVAVRGAGDRDVFAVGDGPFVTHYNGSTWTDIDTSPCAPAGDHFTFGGVFALGNQKALVAGGEGLTSAGQIFADAVMITVDGSSCTRALVASGGGILEDVWRFSDTNIWAVGNGFFHFDGTSWTRSNTSVDLRKLWAFASDNIYAAGAGGLWHFDGSAWTQQSITSSIVNAVAGVSPSDLYVAGDAGLEHWNGSTWSAMTDAGNGSNALATDGTHLFSAAFPGVWMLEASGWTHVDYPSPYDQSVEGLWASTTGPVFATAANRVARYPGGVLTSEQLDTPGVSLAVINPNTIYAFTKSDPEGLWVFNGEDWIGQTGSDPPPYAYSSFDRMWVAPSGNIYFASGASSALEKFSPEQTSTRWSTAAGAVTTTAAMWGTSDTDLWLIMDFGTTFRHYIGSDPLVTCGTCVQSAAYNDLWGTSSTNIYAVGDGGGISHYTGVWTAMSSGTTANLTSIWGTGPTNIYAAGDHALLHYDGASWTALPPPPVNVSSHTLWGTSGRDLFVSSFAGVYHFDGVRWSPMRATLDTNVTTIDGAGDVTYMLDDSGLALRLVRSVSWSAP